MPILQSKLDTRSDSYQRNRAEMLALVEGFRALEAKVRDHGEKARKKFDERGQLLPRERVQDRKSVVRERVSLNV